MAKKYLDSAGLTYLISKIKNMFHIKTETITVTQDSGTTPNYIYTLNAIPVGDILVALNGVIQPNRSSLFEFAVSDGVTLLTIKEDMNIEIGDELMVIYGTISNNE